MATLRRVPGTPYVIIDRRIDFQLSLTEYDAAGRAYRSIDNLGRVTETLYDAAGRTVMTIQNFDETGFVDSVAPVVGDSDQDVAEKLLEIDTEQDIIVKYNYDSAGRLVTMTAYNAKGDDDDVGDDPSNNIELQTTTYLYTSAINGSWQTGVVYPDSDDELQPDASGVWSFTTDNGDHTSTDHDRLGRTISTTDQRGVVHEYSYGESGTPAAGRPTRDDVTTIPGGSGVDDSVLSIVTAYDDLGRVRLISSYSYVSGVGDPVNQIEHVFDGWGNLAVEYQSHDAEVDEEITPAVQYTYADGADENGRAAFLRLTDISYPNDPNGVNGPNGQNVHYNYNTGVQAAVDEIMSRLSSISDSESGETDAAYTYLGAGTIAVEDYAQSQVKLDYDPAGDNSFTGLDRFGRVVDQIWTDYGADPDAVIDHYQYEYDRAGNRVSKTNELDHDLDETYVYDNVDRLTEWYVGDSETPSETWTLDALGNNLGAGSYNAANEETPTQGSSAYDAAGNMITLQSGNSAIYDAWNRLVEVDDASQNILQRNVYDGTNRRIQIYTSFSGSPPVAGTVQDDYYESQQVIQSNITTGGAADGGYQMIWSPRYIDSLILRDTLNTAGTAIVEAARVFYLADANYNVTGLVKYNNSTAVWEVAEHYSYTPYGVVAYYDGFWNTVASSANSNAILFAGRTLDVATDLMYYRARFYDATLERFINRDPIESDFNLYRYCGNDPTVWTDPYGLLTGFAGCDAKQIAALKALEAIAQQQIQKLKQQITNALKTRAHLDAVTVFRLYQMIACLDKASAELKTANVTCENKRKDCMAMSMPGGIPVPFRIPADTIIIAGPFWSYKNPAQAATLVHECTHIACWTTDDAYFWPMSKAPSNTRLGILGFDAIASTHDSMILNGFFVPGVDKPPTPNGPAFWHLPPPPKKPVTQPNAKTL